MTDADTHAHLRQFSEIPDSDLNLGTVAVMLFSSDHSGVSLDKYVRHLGKINADVAARFDELVSQGAQDDVRTRLAALKYVIADVLAYDSDPPDYEVTEGIDFIRVLDRGRGHGSALSVLYMDAARRQGWSIDVLEFPRHLFCRLEYDGERLIFDPAQSCKLLEAHDLRHYIKTVLGDTAELSNHYFDGIDGRGAIVHLANRVKHRRIEMGEYIAALDMVERARVIAPCEYRLLLDAGVLHARLGDSEKAIVCLQGYIDQEADHQKRQDAELLLYDIQQG